MCAVPHESPYPAAGSTEPDNARWAPLTAPSSADESEPGADDLGPAYAAAPPAADEWLRSRPIIYQDIAPVALIPEDVGPEPTPVAIPTPVAAAPRSSLFRGLRRIVGGRRSAASGPIGYTPEACAAFAAGASDALLARSLVLFDELERQTVVDSAALALCLGVPSGRLKALVTEPLERRAAALRLPVPFVLSTSSESGRRTWSDRAGVAAVLVRALRKQQRLRADPGYAPVNEGGSEAA